MPALGVKPSTNLRTLGKGVELFDCKAKRGKRRLAREKTLFICLFIHIHICIIYVWFQYLSMVTQATVTRIHERPSPSFGRQALWRRPCRLGIVCCAGPGSGEVAFLSWSVLSDATVVFWYHAATSTGFHTGWHLRPCHSRRHSSSSRVNASLALAVTVIGVGFEDCEV